MEGANGPSPVETFWLFVDQLFGSGQLSLEKELIKKHALKGEPLIAAQVREIFFILQKIKEFREGEYLGLGKTQGLVQQEKLKGRGKASQPHRIKGIGDHLDDGGHCREEFLARAVKKIEGLVDQVKLLGIDTNAEFTHGPPAASRPFSVIIGDRGFFSDYGRKRGECPLGNRNSAEYLGDFRRALSLFGHEAELLEFVEIVGEISGCRAGSPGAAHVQFCQAVSQQADLGGLTNHGQKLQKGLFELIELIIALKKRGMIGYHKCGLVLIEEIIDLNMKKWIDLKMKNTQFFKSVACYAIEMWI
jgi:hypothetical protein